MRYYAYVGCYTNIGKSKGIAIFEVDAKKGSFHKKKEIECNNSSYLALAHSKKYLYSIVDEGVAAFKILPDGDLEEMNRASIKGMRGCYIYISQDDEYLFVGGHHDGKVTVLRLNEDGCVGEITAQVYHKGLGSIAEKSHNPHVSCVMLTPDEKYLCAVDSGIEQVKLYAFNKENGSLMLKDILRCELDSGPAQMAFSKDGKFMYLVSSLKNTISVYSYKNQKLPEFERIQKLYTVKKNATMLSAACTVLLSEDNKHVLCSNAGDNSVAIFDRDMETGMLKEKNILPISGDYPKSICLFPEDNYLCSVNHETGSLTFFTLDYEKGLIIMNQEPILLDEPNCLVMVGMEE
jgi:6-phosphogluconolactonase